MKRDAGYFEGLDAELVYIARRLPDATRLEEILTAAGLDYGVEAEEYQGGVVFRRTRIGAFFYVLPEDRERVLSVMKSAGYTPLTLK